MVTISIGEPGEPPGLAVVASAALRRQVAAEESIALETIAFRSLLRLMAGHPFPAARVARGAQPTARVARMGGGTAIEAERTLR